MYGKEIPFNRDERSRDIDADAVDLPSSRHRPRVARATADDKLLHAARVCLRHGRSEDAFTLMEQACALAPRNLRYLALLTWLRVERGDVLPGADVQPIAELLTRAVHEYPDDLEIRLYRARSLQRLGRSADALLDFAFVASADARNAEAARELRLHRQRSTPPPAPAIVRSGFFARDHRRAAQGQPQAAGDRR